MHILVSRCCLPILKSSDGAAVTLSLTHLLLTGSCDDLTHGQPPNGLQLQLHRSGSILNTQRRLEAVSEAYSDTLVMQNLGYYQLKVVQRWTMNFLSALSF